jgi:hypothetical protein
MAFYFCLEGGEMVRGHSEDDDVIRQEELSDEAAQRLWKVLRDYNATALPWVEWWKPWRRCRAVKEPNPSGHWGRCELDRDHNYSSKEYQQDHALERGFDTLRWSTKWTN